MQFVQHQSGRPLTHPPDVWPREGRNAGFVLAHKYPCLEGRRGCHLEVKVMSIFQYVRLSQALYPAKEKWVKGIMEGESKAIRQS